MLDYCFLEVHQERHTLHPFIHPKLTTALHWPDGALTVMLTGQVILGGCVSFTFMVNEHDPPAVLVTFTVVVPIGKNPLEAGLAVTKPQTPVTVDTG